MKRIMIIGCSGSGKSTLSVRLSQKTKISVVHLDKLFWKSGWEHRTRDEFDLLLEEKMEKESWIIDGDYSRSMPQRLQNADTVIYLDFKRSTCILGAIHRTLSMYGKTRPDMGENCPERFDLEFYKYIWNFNKNNRRKCYDMLSGQKDKTVYVFRNRKQSERFLEGLTE